MKNKWFIVSGLAVFIALICVYSNHFDNAFHFDDSHAIQDNVNIRDMGNFKRFFTDPTTKSVLPTNQQYRPLLTLSFAIDYAIAGDLNVFYFHLTNFIWYIIQLVLMFLLFRNLLQRSTSNYTAAWLSLAATAWYGFHTVNAETVNYIVARSDSLSTTGVIAGMLLFVSGKAKRWRWLFLLPVAAAMLMKPSAAMFAPLLGWYILVYEYNGQLKQVFKAAFNKWVIGSAVICAGLFYLVMYMTPDTWIPGGNSPVDYARTQPWVIMNYFKTFFLPTHLSADTDWMVIKKMSDPRFITGTLFLILSAAFIFLGLKKQILKPAIFGFGWFFLALAPSSSVIPLSEVTNDHRMFFPNVGLVLAAVWMTYLIFKGLHSRLGGATKPLAVGLAVCIIGLNAYGTWQRNEVWHSEETLWKDVTEKSPHNGRGLMNYGISLMQKGELEKAMDYFSRAKELLPYYSYLDINMAVAKEALGYPKKEIEQHYQNALQYGARFPEPYFYYGRYLKKQGKLRQAAHYLKQCREISPSHIRAAYLLMEIYIAQSDFESLEKITDSVLAINPNDKVALYYADAATHHKSPLDIAITKAEQEKTADSYLELSLAYYKERDFEKCIEAAYKALEVDPEYKLAYNNICSAYNRLGNYAEAIKAGEKALEIDPKYALAINNLAQSKLIRQQIEAADSKNTVVGYLDAGIVLYNQGLYELCIAMNKKALALEPSSAQAYNNICSAYNMLKEWDKAIANCQKALELAPEFALARNNLNWALTEKDN